MGRHRRRVPLDDLDLTTLGFRRAPLAARRLGIRCYQQTPWPARPDMVTTAISYRGHLGVPVADHGQEHAAALMSLIRQDLLLEGRDYVRVPESAARALRALCHPEGGLRQWSDDPAEAGRLLLTPAGALRADLLDAVGWAAGGLAGGEA